MLCHLRTIDDIHEWSKSSPTRDFLKKQFGIEKLPCRAQFYNILGVVDSEKFNCSFIKWMQIVLSEGTAGKTVAIDGIYVRNEQMEKSTKIEKNGGRVEKRTAYVTREIDWLDNREKWKNISCIGAIHTEIEKNKKKSYEWHYYISSGPLTAEEMLTHARLEWRVEAMHWLLDVHFSEEKTRVWDMNVQKTLNILRKIALNLARDYKTKTNIKASISGILKRNLFDLSNLEAFLLFFHNLFKLDCPGDNTN